MNPSTESAREEDIAIAMSWFSFCKVLCKSNVTQAQHQHMAGATYLVSKESLYAGQYKWDEVIGPPAVSTTTREIFDSIQADTVVIKIDVEGHECKALLPEILDQSTGKFVPYIFMEVSHDTSFHDHEL